MEMIFITSSEVSEAGEGWGLPIYGNETFYVIGDNIFFF